MMRFFRWLYNVCDIYADDRFDYDQYMAELPARVMS